MPKQKTKTTKTIRVTFKMDDKKNLPPNYEESRRHTEAQLSKDIAAEIARRFPKEVK